MQIPYEQPAQTVVEERTLAPLGQPLFVLCDAGETNAFIPVMQRLQERGVDFRMVLMGTAAHLVTPNAFPGKVLTLEDLKIKERVDTRWMRDQELSSDSLKKINRYLSPSIVITGTANRVEEQFLKAFPDSRKVAYADKFVYIKNSEKMAVAKRVASVADTVFAVTKLASEALLEDDPTLEIQVMGQPTIEVWQQRIDQIKASPKEQSRIRKRLMARDANEPIVTIAHGYYGEVGLVAKFFDQAEEILREKGYCVNCQMHPKMATPLVPFEEAAAVSDYIVCHDSTAGFLSLFLNKKVIFVVPEGMKYSNFAIDLGFGPKVTSPKELPSALRMMELRPTDNIHEKLGMPRNGIERITESLLQMIKEA